VDLRKIGEFGLLHRVRDWMKASDPLLIQGMGDDVAVFETKEKVLLATTDILIEGIHFEQAWMDPYHLGRKALAVNLSDIAAMGGTPRYFLLSLGLPKDLSLSFISRFYRGLREMAKSFQVDLIGGDTSLSQKLVINICLLGEGKRENLLYRKGGKVGDDLFVTGTLGDSALGLKILQREGPRAKPLALVERHLSPRPRIGIGQAIGRQRVATAMIDVSDGLLIDTAHLLEESGKGARVWEERIPLSRPYQKKIPSYSKDPYGLALSGGEDYELLFTAPPSMRDKISSLAPLHQIPITRIGEILPLREGFRIVRRDGTEYSPSRLGFDHFKQ
jgi:thiamine-monophosphate kinase